MEEVYIVEYARTPFSRSRPKKPERDVFHQIRGDELMAMVLEKLPEKAGVEKKDVGRILLGCAFPVSENWPYGGRMSTLLAKYPPETSASHIDMQRFQAGTLPAA